MLFRSGDRVAKPHPEGRNLDSSGAWWMLGDVESGDRGDLEVWWDVGEPIAVSPLPDLDVHCACCRSWAGSC